MVKQYRRQIDRTPCFPASAMPKKPCHLASDSLGQMLELQAIFELSAADHVFRQKVPGAVSLSISFFGTYNSPFHNGFS
jgi:hypothetical protein